MNEVSQCPQCGEQARPVETITLKALLRPEALARLEVEASYRFCDTPTCSVVYFADQARSVFRKEELKVRVGLKEADDPIPLCYCFGHTRASLREEIEREGKASAPATIAAHIKAGRCGCDVNNPGGACCLGQVHKAAKELTP